MPDVADLLPGSWVHSREEDAEGVRTYRRADRPLPRTRLPRQVLTFESNGHVISATAGPADSRVARDGRWSIERTSPLVIALHWPTHDDCLMPIIELTQDVLQVSTSDTTIE